MFKVDKSTIQEHQGSDLDLNHFTSPIPVTQPAGEPDLDRKIHNIDSLDEYINHTLAQAFSALSFDDVSLAADACRKPESFEPVLMRGQREGPSSSTIPMPLSLGSEGRHANGQTRGVTPHFSSLSSSRLKMAGYETLLGEAEQALRRHIVYKTDKLFTEQGPDSAEAFLTALCTLSTESFDRLWAGIFHPSTSNYLATTLCNNTKFRSPDLNEKKTPKYTGKRTQIMQGKLEQFVANAVGALIRLVDSHWERLTRGLEAQELHEDHTNTDKRLLRLYHHLALRKLEQEAELHWLRRALALIRNLCDFEEYLEENGHPLSNGLNQRLRYAYLTEIYAAASRRSNSNVKTAFKEDLRYASRWMIFLRRFGLGAILVCGESISRLVYKTSGNNNGDLEWLAMQIQHYHAIDFQGLCNTLNQPVSNIIQNYCTGVQIEKSELIARIQTFTQPN